MCFLLMLFIVVQLESTEILGAALKGACYWNYGTAGMYQGNKIPNAWEHLTFPVGPACWQWGMCSPELVTSFSSVG